MFSSFLFELIQQRYLVATSDPLIAKVANLRFLQEFQEIF